MKKKPTRQYFNTKIDVLCSLAEENKCNVSILKKIQHELTFRSTKKAKNLAERIKQFLMYNPQAKLDRQKAEQIQLPYISPPRKTPQLGEQEKKWLEELEHKQKNMSEN